MAHGNVMPLIRVLIADDHPIVRAGLCSMLDLAEDIEVVAAVESTADAVSVVCGGQEKIDVVLMDLRFGDTPSAASDTGKEAAGVVATRKIREWAVSRLPHVAQGAGGGPQVLVVTNYSTDHDVLSAVRAGAVGYLLKDCTPEQLMEGIRQAAVGKTVMTPHIVNKLMGQFNTQQGELTQREIQVLSTAARGLSNKQIARDLVLTEATVKTHMGNIFHKLGVSNRTAAVAVARERGIL